MAKGGWHFVVSWGGRCQPDIGKPILGVCTDSSRPGNQEWPLADHSADTVITSQGWVISYFQAFSS